MRFSSASGMRAADQEAIISRGIPSLELMETAAGRLTDAAQKLLGGLHGKKAVVFSGSGNNGGDGLAAARLMKQRGALVSVWMTGNAERLTHDTAHMLRKARECSAEVREFEQEAAGRDCSDAHIILDAMFGIGLNSPIRGVGVEAVGIINDSPAKVIAVDIASGVEADTGRILGRAVRADMTVTFTCAKPGHVVEPGCASTGELIIADIGIPEDIVKSALLEMDLVTGRYVKEHLPQRLPISHKGNYGRILVIAGSRGYTGAPSLAANAASRAGAGLVFVGVPACIYPTVAQKCSETMPFPLPDDSAGSTWQRGALTLEALEPLLERLGAAQVCLIGPGLGRAPETAGLVLELISRSERAIVLDADGINALQGHIDLLKRARCLIILTPHEGEFFRRGGDR